MSAKAELQAILDADNKPFIRAMDQAVRKQKSVGREMEKSWGNSTSKFGAMGAMMGRALPVAAAVAGAGAIGRSIFRAGGEIQDMSDAISLTTDQFQKFSFAIEQAGGNEDTLVKAMGAIIAKMDEAKTEGGKTAEQFERVGVSAQDLEANISKSEVLLRLADHLKKANGSAEATAAVMDIVGSKVALKLVPALKDGRAVFLEVGESARIMEAQTISSLDGIGDKLNQFKKSARANIANNVADLFGFMSGKKPETKSPQFKEPDEAFMMPPITVRPGRRPGFWQQDLPTMTKPMGMQDRMGPFPEGMNSPENWGGQFRGFGSGYFPGKSGGLTTGGLRTGGLQSSGGLGDAYGRIRRGDAARAKSGAKQADPVQDAIAENTAGLLEQWGGKGRRK